MLGAFNRFIIQLMHRTSFVVFVFIMYLALFELYLCYFVLTLAVPLYARYGSTTFRSTLANVR